MSNIKSVAIIGAGALGTLYAQYLSKVPGIDLFFGVGRDRYDRMKECNFVINEVSHNFNFRNLQADSSANCVADLVIVAVKNHHLESILPLLGVCVGKNTIVMSVLNGIYSETFLEEHFPDAVILYSVPLGMDAVKEKLNLTFSTSGKLLLGSKNNNPEEIELKKLGNLLDSADLKYEIPEDIHRSIWWKWMINIGVNQASAVTGASYYYFQKDKNAQILMEKAMRETILVAKAAGVDLRDKDIDDFYTVLNTLGPKGKTSMLQDIENKRKTEVDAFAGKLIELADSLGVDVPINKLLLKIIKVKESVFSDYRCEIIK
ncbi:MAG: 2-dehydropantoate 2-reductase [Spirochaetes bacterium]|nr:MAG: 2-dehydropantoate 2-reductase [Spirochaetota bacterium]